MSNNNTESVGQNKSSYAPVITIITSTLNCCELLANTAASIREQTYRKIQWIIADGGSSDGTIDVFNKNGDLISYWVSEPDSGIYDAWNKACNYIQGDWVIFLGAGDVLCEPRTLESVVARLSLTPDDVVIAYGNVIQKQNGAEIYRYGQVNLGGWDIYRPTLPAHQGVFQKSSLFKSFTFDSSYQMAADSKFMFESLKKGCAEYFDVDVCFMEPGGISSNPKYELRKMREFFQLEKDLGYKIPFIRKYLYITITFVRSALYHIGGVPVITFISRLKSKFKNIFCA